MAHIKAEKLLKGLQARELTTRQDTFARYQRIPENLLQPLLEVLITREPDLISKLAISREGTEDLGVKLFTTFYYMPAIPYLIRNVRITYTPFPFNIATSSNYIHEAFPFAKALQSMGTVQIANDLQQAVLSSPNQLEFEAGLLTVAQIRGFSVARFVLEELRRGDQGDPTPELDRAIAFLKEQETGSWDPVIADPTLMDRG